MEKLTLSLSQPIATGRTADIHAWQKGQVLKLFHNWFELEDIEYEARVARAVQASGLPVPMVGEVICVNDRIGLIYQRVDGKSMWAGLVSKPWRVFFLARRVADLQAEMHTRVVQVDLPSQRRRLINKINNAKNLPENLRTRALISLESLPDGDRLCHGDFHPDNILTTGRTETIIDWIDASYGNPIADVARTTIILLGAADKQIHGLFQRFIIRIFHSAYLHQYFKSNPGKRREYERWLPVVAAARLSENIGELEDWLISKAEKGLRAV